MVSVAGQEQRQTPDWVDGGIPVDYVINKIDLVKSHIDWKKRRKAFVFMFQRKLAPG